MKVGIAGSIQSNDIQVTVTEGKGIVIEIESIVDAFFHDEIEKVIKDTLKELKIDNIKVSCIDKGALNYTIKSRLLCAIERMEEK